MLRILTRTGLVLALSAFVSPVLTESSEAGSRYKSGKSKSSPTSSRAKRTRGAIYLSIPNWWYVNGERRNTYQQKTYRGGPKIINVEEELRRRRERNKREMIN